MSLEAGFVHSGKLGGVGLASLTLNQIILMDVAPERPFAFQALIKRLNFFQKMKITNNTMNSRNPKHIVWFSCGAPSAICADLAIKEFGAEEVEVCYCNTLAYEHPDNKRFMKDVEAWLGIEIKILSSEKYKDIYDVFDKTGWLVGNGGARCTTELKKVVRENYQVVGDVHIFGLTAEEHARAQRMRDVHHDIRLDFILQRNRIYKDGCLEKIKAAGIEIPQMYKLGYNNNNCIGCVKGGAGYWNKIRKDFPDHFSKMAIQERKMGVACLKVECGINEDGKKQYRPLFLDELEPWRGDHKTEHSFECGVMCQIDMFK